MEIGRQTSSDARTVTVTGHGTAEAVPDSAMVRVAAVARAHGVAEAFRSCSSAAAAIGDVARRHTGGRRITSTGINVWPWHDDQGRRRGFEARHSMAIGCGDLDVAGTMLAELTSEIDDALVVEGVALEVASPVAAQEQAVARAFEDAVRQAALLAGLAEASLGEVLAVSQGGSAHGGPHHHDAMALSAKIEPGETTIGASVTVTWSLSGA